jgi:hypothetical protein
MVSTAQPILMKHVLSFLLASGPIWRPLPPLRSWLPHSHLYSIPIRFLVVLTLTSEFPHKIPSWASITLGLSQCNTVISSMASGLHSQGLSRHVLPHAAPGFLARRRWSGWWSSPNFASILLAPDDDDLALCSGGQTQAQGTKKLLSYLVSISGANGELCCCLCIAAELGLGCCLHLSWRGVLRQSQLPRGARGPYSPVGSTGASVTCLATTLQPFSLAGSDCIPAQMQVLLLYSAPMVRHARRLLAPGTLV